MSEAHDLIMRLYAAREDRKAAVKARSELYEDVKIGCRERMYADKIENRYNLPDLLYWATPEEKQQMNTAHDRVLQAGYQIGAALRAVKKYGDAHNETT